MSLLREGFVEISSLERHKFPVLGLRHYLIRKKPTSGGVQVVSGSNQLEEEEEGEDGEDDANKEVNRADDDSDSDEESRDGAGTAAGATTTATGTNSSGSTGRQLLLSWDAKNMYAWQHGRVAHHLNFGNKLENVLNCFAFSSALHVFIANSQKNAFHIYDNNFKLLEVIPHKERMITALEYDETHDYIIMNGSGGNFLFSLCILLHLYDTRFIMCSCLLCVLCRNSIVMCQVSRYGNFASNRLLREDIPLRLKNCSPFRRSLAGLAR